MIIFAEHWYYGTLPYDNKSYYSPYIQYLTSELALADYAYLIEYIKQNETTNSPVIAFGGSYGGMLSAWLRIKNPSLINGA